MNSGPVVSETLLPGRPPPQTQGIRRVLRLRGARFRTTHPGLSPRRRSAPAPRTRLGISVPRRVGRRRACAIACGGGSREIFRRTRSLFGATPVAVVVNARPSAAAASFQELSEDYAAGGHAGPGAAAAAMNAGARLAVAILDFYKRFLSPLLPRACRFEPTCSVYAREAIARHGLGRGIWLAGPAPAALPPVPSGRPRSRSLNNERYRTHGKTSSPRRRPLSGRPADLGVARPQAAETARLRRVADPRRPSRRTPAATGSDTDAGCATAPVAATVASGRRERRLPRR